MIELKGLVREQGTQQKSYWTGEIILTQGFTKLHFNLFWALKPRVAGMPTLIGGKIKLG
jgi:hypothetical protein